MTGAAVSWPLVVTVAGWVGTVGLLMGYALVSSGRLAGDGFAYQLVNVLGSIGLGAAAFSGRVWPAVALNGVWALIGLVALNRLGWGAGSGRGVEQPPGAVRGVPDLDAGRRQPVPDQV